MSRIEEALSRAAERRLEMAGAASGIEAGAVPVMAQVPRVSSFAKTFTHFEEEVPERLKHQHMLVTLNDPAGHAAEEYRKLKESIVNISKKKGFRNTLMITSSSVGEGKSVTSVNLAISLAQEMDFTVLLIDADLRRPTCHTLLNLDNEKGLSDFLLGATDVSSLICKTGVGKLSFMPAGKATPNPGELLASNRMVSLLEEVKHRYPDRFVLIDTPPALPFAETRSLSRMVDGAVLVIREGASSQKDIAETVEALRETSIYGTVLNQASNRNWMKKHGYYYDRYYSAAR
ncbi:XrtA-associated tyrosine autokinase [Desulfovibrio psychrotolerans]|uniref:non-specific protein-tyrosine kinase n=1 Tax=Desulfovibrio psychrotolerans TaxID=415242 RepID=A0A7J0BUD3_9BACT|nr:XrtA-associated tyrosine autokinase [Desulfovibrio psychrotolerans]GFM37327.1 polysaccharide biosynthesis protein [Desulfovibrio psychrotolerans]